MFVSLYNSSHFSHVFAKKWRVIRVDKKGNVYFLFRALIVLYGFFLDSCPGRNDAKNFSA